MNMDFDFSAGNPLFMQVAEQIEDGIFTGIFREGEQIPSTTEISVQYNMNPATVLKGMNKLVENGYVYKKRGVGLFVEEGAQQRIADMRSRQFYDRYIRDMVKEARKLGLDKEGIIRMLEEGFRDEV